MALDGKRFVAETPLKREGFRPIFGYFRGKSRLFLAYPGREILSLQAAAAMRPAAASEPNGSELPTGEHNLLLLSDIHTRPNVRSGKGLRVVLQKTTKATKNTKEEKRQAERRPFRHLPFHSSCPSWPSWFFADARNSLGAKLLS